MKRWAIVFATACSSLFAAEISTEVLESIRFSGTNHTLFSSSEIIPGDRRRLNTLMSETLLRGEYSRYTGSVHFSNRFYPERGTGENLPFNLEKKTLAVDWDIFQLKAGDFYQEFGKGIALSFYKDPVLGVDNSLEGVSLRLFPKMVDVGIFAGRVNALRSPVAINPLVISLLEDNIVWMGGGYAAVRPGEDWKVGLHYVGAVNEKKSDHHMDKSWHTTGVSLTRDAIFEVIDLYAETNVLITRVLEGLEPDPAGGYGTYVSASWVGNPWMIKLEGKDYRNYRFDFRRPPTLEEDMIENINVTDVTSAKLTGEYRDGDLVVTASHLSSLDRFHNTTVNHPTLGGKFSGFWNTTWEWKAGYRWESDRARLWHASLKNKIPTFYSQSLEVGYRRIDSRDQIGTVLENRLERNIFSFIYNLSDSFYGGFGYEFVPFNPDPAAGRNFLNAVLQYKSGTFAAHAFLGKTSGGTICSGGVCSKVPAYNGGQAEITVLF